uniref:Uncharacterized protein n=1 Tax=Arundo donax TaxID=35708 RepID=A0A0A9FG99_ARUDO
MCPSSNASAISLKDSPKQAPPHFAKATNILSSLGSRMCVAIIEC